MIAEFHIKKDDAMQLTIDQSNMPKYDYDPKYFHLLKASLIYEKNIEQIIIKPRYV